MFARTRTRVRERRRTNVVDLRVLHNELVHGDGSDPKQDSGENHGDDSWDPSQDTEATLWLGLRNFGL